MLRISGCRILDLVVISAYLKSMNIAINERDQERIRRKVEAGLYRSPDEAIARALELLDAHDEEFAELQSKVQKGIEELENGQFADYTDETLHELFEGVKRRGRQRRASRQSTS
ncbi:MAG: ribbon-helix-helix domain-containing protein, partial [Ardenticatenaceae bacterium]